MRDAERCGSAQGEDHNILFPKAHCVQHEKLLKMSSVDRLWSPVGWSMWLFLCTLFQVLIQPCGDPGQSSLHTVGLTVNQWDWC